MFYYTISKKADEEKFWRTCNRIQKIMKKYIKKPLLQDVDGTTIQIYFTKKGKIKVCNDYEVDAVYVDSDFAIRELAAMAPVKYTLLDGTKEQRERIVRDFLGLKPGQTFQDIVVDDEDED